MVRRAGHGVVVVMLLASCGRLGFDGTDAGEVDAPWPGDRCVATAISANSAHTCIVRDTGQVACWGNNLDLQIGSDPERVCYIERGSMSVDCNPTPADVAISPAAHLGLADRMSCAIAGSGTATCWGDNRQGQAGNGQLIGQTSPTLIAERTGASTIIGGNDHLCSLHEGQVRCAGGNAYGELGNGSVVGSALIVVVQLPNVSVLAAGYEHTCAVSSGVVYCWGDNALGQVDPSTGAMIHPTPVVVTGVPLNPIGLATGIGHSCALYADRTLRCWGDNRDGQLGDGSLMPRVTPVIGLLTDVVELRAGVDHTCARTNNGSVSCWGEDGRTSSGTPIAVELPGPARALAVGSYHGCAILDDGSVICWGWNGYGQHGDGTSEPTNVTSPPSRALLCP